jgi:DNA-binding Xre family transcriptional regulator
MIDGNMSALNLDYWLKERGRNLLWLSKKTNIEYKSLHRYLTNQNSGIQMEHVSAICNALSITPNDLFNVNKRLRRVEKKERARAKTAAK